MKETKPEEMQKWQSEKIFDEFKSGLLRVFVDCEDVYFVGNASIESISAEGLSNLITPKYDKIDLEEFLKEWKKLL